MYWLVFVTPANERSDELILGFAGGIHKPRTVGTASECFSRWNTKKRRVKLECHPSPMAFHNLSPEPMNARLSKSLCQALLFYLETYLLLPFFCSITSASRLPLIVPGPNI